MRTGASFEWYLRTFYNTTLDNIPESQSDSYRNEFEIWQEASGEDKRKMWPTRLHTYGDIEERE